MDPIGGGGSSGVTTAVPQRVFLSHTSDLGKHTEPGSFVAAAVEAVLRARHAVTDMAYFAARDTSPAAMCVDMVAQSHVYVGIIGQRYGSPVHDRPDVSYTELEFATAGEHRQPRLIFLVREDSAHMAAGDEPAELRARQGAFRRRLLDSGLTVVQVATPAELALALYQALVELGPTPDAPARLADAQALLASMPTDTSEREVATQSGFGAVLRNFRAAANLTQEDLAERSGMSAQAISALERGSRRTPRPSTIEFLAEALKLDARHRKTLVAAATGPLLPSTPMDTLPERGPLPPGSRMPLAPNPLFVGRGDELRQVAAALRGGDTTVALGQVVASTGLGGLGKTQLAVELVHRCGRYFAGGAFWLSFASADEIPLQVAACAEPGLEVRPLEERVQRVKDAWQSAVPRLLVFDNCEEEALLEAWRPSSGGCRVLVTSRRSHWSPTLGVTALPLDTLPRPDSIKLLRLHRPDVAEDDPGLDAIAAELGDLPLALHLAGSYLRAYPVEVSLAGYLAELRQEPVVQHASLLGAGLDGSPSPTHHVQSVAQTFALCLGRLDRKREVDQVAMGLLARVACMAPGEPVPRDLLTKTMEDVDPRLRADALRRLAALGLAEEGEGWLRVHRLVVHFVRQQGLDPNAQSEVARALITCGENAELRHLTGVALAAVIPHVIDVAGAACESTCNERLAAKLCAAAGRALEYVGDLRAARPWYERTLAIREKVLGSDHPDTAQGLNDLARLFWAQGDMAAAKPLYERALEIRERVLGPDHPDTAQSLNNLGILLQHQGKLAPARALLERALDIRTRVLGPEHPDTAEGLNNLGILLRDRGNLSAARSLLERTVACLERVERPDHPHIAHALNNLALILQDQGELAAARHLFERALAIDERVLGPDHPDTARSLNNLGALLRDQGEMFAAKPILEHALELRERILGPKHPRTAVSLNDLALLVQAQGDPTAARSLFERALAIRERVYGPDHPDTVVTRRALEELAAEGDGAATED